MKYNIGDKIKTIKYDYEGLIYDRHNYLPESKRWRLNQEIKITKKEMHGNWYRVSTLINGNYYGSITVSESDIIPEQCCG